MFCRCYTLHTRANCSGGGLRSADSERSPKRKLKEQYNSRRRGRGFLFLSFSLVFSSLVFLLYILLGFPSFSHCFLSYSPRFLIVSNHKKTREIIRVKARNKRLRTTTPARYAVRRPPSAMFPHSPTGSDTRLRLRHPTVHCLRVSCICALLAIYAHLHWPPGIPISQSSPIGIGHLPPVVV